MLAPQKLRRFLCAGGMGDGSVQTFEDHRYHIVDTVVATHNSQYLAKWEAAPAVRMAHGCDRYW
jgi:hypothetical protein